MRKLFTAAFALMIITGCGKQNEQVEQSIESEKINTQPAKSIQISSSEELFALFAQYQYDSEHWQQGLRSIPRMTFHGVTERWKEISNKMPVKQKKEIFFRLMAPLILLSNEKIAKQRQAIVNAKLTDKTLLKLANEYHVIDEKQQSLTEALREKLLEKVDIIPPSLALAQAAEESGWGTSRFAEQGNAFFGQWDFSGNGMIPKQQRKELGNYGLAKFDSPLASVEGYMKNINTTSAYHKFRQLRAELRANEEKLTGIELAGTLDKYSERGQAYIDGIREMISYNKLEQVDDCYLQDNQLIHIE